MFPEWALMRNVQNDDSRTRQCPVCEAKDGLQLDIVYMKQNIGWHWRFSMSEDDCIWHCQECKLRGTLKQLDRRADTQVNRIRNRLHQGETLFVECCDPDVTYGAPLTTILKLVPTGDGKYEQFWLKSSLVWEQWDSDYDVESIKSEVLYQVLETETAALERAAQLKGQEDEAR